MITKPHAPTVIGVSEQVPEGIFGVMDLPPEDSTTEAAVAKAKKAKKKKKFVQIGEHKVELTDMIHIGVDLRKKRKGEEEAPKKKRVKKLGKRNLKPIRVEPIKKPKAAKKAPPPGIMPAFEINYDAAMPKEAEGLPLDNVVSISEELLQRVANKTQRRTEELSKLLLNSVTPSMLSYDAASNYVKAVLSDGLKIDIDVDRGVLEVVKELSRMDVIFFYLKRLSLPRSLKERYMQSFIDELAKASLESMKKTDKSDAISSQLRELEGVILKRSEHQARESNAKKRDKRIGVTDEAGAVKRTRKDQPIGGF